MKKLLLYICCLALLCGGIPAAAAGGSAAVADANALLCALGIINENAAYDWDEMISRGEFVDLAVRLTGVTQAELDAAEPVDYFIDVQDSLYRNALSYAGSRGYISGYGDKRFYPSAQIQAAEAVKIVLDIMGYSKLAKFAGGYPAGYINIAGQNQFTDGLAVAGTLRYQDAILLIKNALHANVQELGVDRDILDGGETALEKFFSVTILRGVVDSNEYSGLYLPGGCARGCVTIDGTQAGMGASGIAEYLGYRVEAYVRDDADEYTCVYFQTYKTTVLTVEAGQIEEAAEDVLTYYTEQNRRKTVKLAPGLSVLENGAALPQYGPEDFMPANGTVSFIDNTGDGGYDVASIWTSVNYFVSGIDAEQKLVYDYYAKEPLDFEGDEADRITLLKDGAPAQFSDIRAEGILSVSRSRDNARIKVEISGYDALTGQIGSIRTETDGVFVSVDGENFKVSETYMDMVRQGAPNTEDIRSQSGTFYLDIYGEIAAVIYDETGYLYGVAKRVYTDPDYEDRLFLKLYSQNNVWETLVLDKKTAVNGEKERSGYTLEDMEKLFGTVETAEGTAILPQVVKYEKNKDQTLKKLEVSTAQMTPVEAEEKEVFALNEKIKDKYYNETGQKLDNRYLMTANTVIFSLVDFKDDPSAFSPEDIEVLQFASIPGGSGKTMDIYDASISNIPGAVIWWTGANVASANFDSVMQLSYVTGVDEGLDKDGDPTKILTGYKGGARFTCPEKTQGLFDDVQRGDILHLVLDEKGEAAISYKLVYRDEEVDKEKYFQAYDSSLFGKDEPDYNKKYAMFKNVFTKRSIANYTPFTNGIATNVFTGDNSAMTVAHGYVYQGEKDFLSLICEQDVFDTEAVAYNNTILRTYIYDQSVKYYRINMTARTVQPVDKGALRNSSAYNIRNGSEALIATRNGSIREVFIFER